MQLGRVRSVRDERTLRFTNYCAIEGIRAPDEWLPPSPAQEAMHKDGCFWPMLGNDRYPCCASAAAGHMVHHWTEVNEEVVLLTEQPILQAHEALTGGAPQNGVSMLEALKYWRKKGIGDHSIHSFLEVRATDREDVKRAVHLFGAAYLGLDLPNFAYPTPLPADLSSIPAIPWEIPAAASPEDCQPRPEKGHCVAAIGYDEKAVSVVTWGTLKTMTWEFFERYTVESFAVLSHDWVGEAKLSPTGFALRALEHDLSLVSGLAQAKAGHSDDRPADLIGGRV